MAEQRKGQRSKPAKVRATARAGAYKTPGNRSESSLKKECDWVLDSLDGLEEVGS
jgi:hypothetical protein